MNLGYDRPLYLLPFDHRHACVSGMFDFALPLSPAQQAEVSDSKRLVYEGFRRAVEEGVPGALAGIVVDEEFGAGLLRDAHTHGFVTALPVEHSGPGEFECEYGADFASHIEAFDPTFVKVRVHYNPESDAVMNRRQSARLKLVSDHCRQKRRRFMFELLVPPTRTQLAAVAGDRDTYDTQTRPLLTERAIRELQRAGVEPDVWKVEGLARREDCERIVATARQHGRDAVGCIVVGRGADDKKLRRWLGTAARVEGFIGFAVGRTSFSDALAAFRAGTSTRAEAAAQIARRFREWTDIFEHERLAFADDDEGEALVGADREALP